MGVEYSPQEFFDQFDNSQEGNTLGREGISLYGLPRVYDLPSNLWDLGDIVKDELTKPFMEAVDPEFYAKYQEGIVGRYGHSEMPEGMWLPSSGAFVEPPSPENLVEIIQWMVAFDRRFEELQREGKIPTTPSLFEEAERINQQVWHSNGWYREIRTYVEANLPAPDSPSPF